MSDANGGSEPRRPRVALLVDGENVSHTLSVRIILKAQSIGDLAIMRVYGNAAQIPGWDKAARFRLIHSGTGKNATDMLLTIEAMALAYSGGAEIFCIASSDRDYSHLVLHLREKGHQVIGMGEAKAEMAYRKAFARWEDLTPSAPVAVAPKPAPPVAPKAKKLDDQIAEILQQEGGALPISRLGARMHSAHGVKISQRPEKTWRAYLLSRAMLFRCDPRGPDAKVSLIQATSH